MSSTCQPLPVAWVERIFERMTLVYGAQKVSTMWVGPDPQAVKSAWADALGRYPRDALSAAVLSVQDAHPSWPPTLGEFCAHVASKVPRPEHRPALPVPRRTADEIAAGRAQMDAIRAMVSRGVKRTDSAEPPPPPPACRCRVGLTIAEQACDACRQYAARRGVVRETVANAKREIAA